MRRLLFADDRGTVYDHPGLLAAARSGDDVVQPRERPALLPAGARLVWLPGRRPVGVDSRSGAPVVLREVKVRRRTVIPHAVGAVLPPGWTRTLLPAAQRSPLATGSVLPQWAYTAAAQGDRGPVAWALHTDRRRHWSVERHGTPDLPRRVERLLDGSKNPIYRQLRRCAGTGAC